MAFRRGDDSPESETGALLLAKVMLLILSLEKK